LRIEAIGAVDELNSSIGVLLAENLEEALRAKLKKIQHDLFDLGGDLSIPGRLTMGEAQVARLEQQLDEYNNNLPALRDFILPGGVRSAALCHVARAISRRAERCLVRLSRSEAVPSAHLRYVNRLSDLMFVFCRILNLQHGVADILWQSGKPRTDESV
jgi:cob(I)alamin adenosyltransferase